MRIKLDDYTVGALAKFYGISTDAIRLYDKKGILPSHKNDENNYRIYSRSDLIVMDFIVKLRAMDISLADIKDITDHFDVEQTSEYCCRKVRQMDQEIERLVSLRGKLAQFSATVTNIQQDLDKITIRENPVFILKDIEESIAHTNKAFDSFGLDTLPLLCVYWQDSFGQEMIEQISDKKNRALADYYISQEDNMGVTANADFPKDQFTILQPRLCVHTVVKVHPNLGYHEFEKIVAYAQLHNFSLTGEALSRVILTEKKMSDNADYYDCWYPLKNEG